MRRLRSRPSHATVVAYVALFVALGGTASAAVIITDNSQVASNTISGHKPPSGKHANLIAGSVNGQDVANDSLGGADILESSLTGDARSLIYNAGASPFPNAPITNIATVGPYTIKGQCSSFGGSVVVDVYVNGPAGTADTMIIRAQNQNFTTVQSGTLAISANTNRDILEAGGDSGAFDRMAGTVILRTGSTLVQVDFNGVADAPSGTCFLYGTATRAT